jgi:NAD(P)-dependent dehydrogenase (short-subunit alcohol dehydrogenase family)
MKLTGKTAVIAGNAWGLGHATALMFARAGAEVICIDDNPETKAARVLRMDGFELPYFHADVTDAAQVRAVASALEKTLAKVDTLFNVAGRDPIRQTFEKTTHEAWATMIGRNLSSAFLCAQAFLPLMKKAGSGSIINHGSIDGVLGNPSIAAYSAGKGGLLPLTHVMAHDLGKYNIRVNCISTAGPRKTTVPQTPVEQSRVAVTPLRRQGTVQDIAPLVLFLASDEASFISGANIVVDGGRTATTHGCYEEL